MAAKQVKKLKADVKEIEKSHLKRVEQQKKKERQNYLKKKEAMKEQKYKLCSQEKRK